MKITPWHNKRKTAWHARAQFSFPRSTLTKPLPSMFVLAGGINNQRCCCHDRMCSWSWKGPLETGESAPSVCLSVILSAYGKVTSKHSLLWHRHQATKTTHWTVYHLLWCVIVFTILSWWTRLWRGTHFPLLSWSLQCSHGWFGSPALRCPAGLGGTNNTEVSQMSTHIGTQRCAHACRGRTFLSSLLFPCQSQLWKT